MKYAIPGLAAVYLLLPVSAQAAAAVNRHIAASQKARDQKKWADAESEAAAAGNEAEKLGPKSPLLANAAENLGYIYYLQGKQDKIEALFRRAVEIGEASGQEQAIISKRLNYVGNAQMMQSKWLESIASFQRSLAIDEKVFGRDHLEVGNVLFLLAQAQFRSGNLKGAEVSSRRAVQILEPLVGSDRLLTANALMLLGNVLRAEADYDGAAAEYQKALNIRIAIKGSESADVAEVQTLLGDLFLPFRLNRVTEAEKILRAALNTEERLMPRSADISATMGALAIALQTEGKYAEA